MTPPKRRSADDRSASACHGFPHLERLPGARQGYALTMPPRSLSEFLIEFLTRTMLGRTLTRTAGQPGRPGATAMTWTRALIIGALTLGCGASLTATSGSKSIPAGKLKAEPGTIWIRDGSSRVTTQSAAPLRVENVRLEAEPRSETVPSTVLKFDVFNASLKRLTDLVLEISITEKPSDQVPGPSRMLVRPFKIRGNVVLESGYTINYEMLLRQFSSDCDCIANVDVLSVRSLPDSD